MKKTDYKNWVPKEMVVALTACTTLLLAGLLCVCALVPSTWPPRVPVMIVLTAALCVCFAYTGWSVTAYRAFSYGGKRQLSRQIIEGTAAHISLPAGGRGLDVGCGSGALTIACAKANPQGAKAEGVENVSFRQGDAVKLDFPDGYFDAVTSNYVYHNITGADKQKLLLESLRVLKKGGCFAIHDLMSPRRYGDMEAFLARLKAEGYERVELIDTTKGLFMSGKEAKRLMLHGSTLLIGKK